MSRPTDGARPRVLWGGAALATAAVLFWAATTDAVYEATSPPGLSWHVALRKAYSIVAFALIGFLAEKTLSASSRALLRGAVLVALYSAAIEVVQAHDGSAEGFIWNAVDVACGAMGGVVGVALTRIGRARG